jgi:hypothetical protein
LDFFRSHMKKIVALRAENESTLRYLSKNNLNISRLACLPSAFPDAKIIVPFREPLQHASSLLKQHRAFLEAHRDDAFASAYMAGIGHYDFGVHLRPVNFDGWLDRDRRPDALELGFWVEYWIAAYRNILKYIGGRVQLISYEKLTSSPSAGLEWLASFLELDDVSRLAEHAARIRAPGDHEIDTSTVGKGLIGEARDLYTELLKRSGF